VGRITAIPNEPLFFSTKKDGLGFGLWRDKNFIQQLGGDIIVSSHVGVGSKFTLKIPVVIDIGEER
jgi:signal transduction histidine kinase